MNDPSPSRSASAVALTATALATLTALLAAQRMRLTPAERDFAWPWTASMPDLDLTLVVVGAITILAAAAAWTAHRDPLWRQSLVECLVWPAIPVAIAWQVVPAVGPPSTVAAIATVMVGLVAWGLFRREAKQTVSAARRRTGRPRQIWIGLHATAAAILAALGIWGSGFEDPVAFVLSLALYPVYAYCQLFLVLAVTWPRLQRLAGGGMTGPIVTVALLFALVHWPNPTLMALTGGGMAFWAVAYARGRSLVVLAISMGLLATLAAQGLPDHWTDHMRAGPRFVRARAVPELARDAAARTRHLPGGETRTSAFVADLYPGIVGRTAADEELARWWRSIVACRRGVLAWSFYISEEYQREFARPAGEAPLPSDVHWTRLPAPWPRRIGAYTHHVAASPDSSWDGFVARLYREILRRGATSTERSAWHPDLSSLQQQRVVQLLLNHCSELAAAPFDTCTCARMRLHY